jgi:hypothetical protein
VRIGGRIEVRVSLARTGRGKYRYGATGKYYRWPIVMTANGPGLGKKVTRCLNPGSRKPVKCR